MKLPQLSLRDLFWLVLVVVLASALVMQQRRWSAAQRTLLKEPATAKEPAAAKEPAVAKEANRSPDDPVEQAHQSGLPIVVSAPVPTFEITLKPQRAVFFTEHCKGGAGHPVHTSARFLMSKTLSMDDRQILLEHDTGVLLEEQAGERRNTSTTTILVDAEIHLEPASGDQSTDPPTTVTFYAVKIDKLHSAQWQRD